MRLPRASRRCSKADRGGAIAVASPKEGLVIDNSCLQQRMSDHSWVAFALSCSRAFLAITHSKGCFEDPLAHLRTRDVVAWRIAS